MGDARGALESHSLRGPIDRAALIHIRDIINETEPLATAQLDDYLSPTVLHVEFTDGLCNAEAARIDVQWTTEDDYAFHYTDSDGINLRWGNHPHNGDYIHVTGLAHYHPPPDASSEPDDVEDSCITVSPERLVTRAVQKLWRVAYHTASLEALNKGENPP